MGGKGLKNFFIKNKDTKKTRAGGYLFPQR